MQELRAQQGKEEETKTGKKAIDELAEMKFESASDQQGLLDAFDRFFVDTVNFDLQALSELVCALAQLTVGALEQLKYSGQNSLLSGLPLQRAINSDRASGGMFMTQTDSEILA